MRFFEFSSANIGPDKFELLLRNEIGQAARSHSPAFLNWEALSNLARANGFELAIDQSTFAAMYDANPELQQLVSDFSKEGVQLNVPGTADSKDLGAGTGDGQTSQEKVDQMASAAAPKQNAQSELTPPAPPPPPAPSLT